jgi:hypothetical protein
MEPFPPGTNASGDLIGLPPFGSMSRTRTVGRIRSSAKIRDIGNSL